MTEKEIQDIFSSIRGDISSRRLTRAMETLTSNAEQSMNWEISDRIKSLARDYSYMLDYMAAGYPDEGRITLYRDISERTLSLADMLERRMLSLRQPSLYFSTLRVAEASGKTIADLVDEFVRLRDDSENLFARIASGGDSTDSDRSGLEGVALELFNTIWTAYPLNREDIAAIRRLLTEHADSPVWCSMLLSALMLGELEYHDSARLELIIDIYSSAPDVPYRAQALVALLLSLYRHRERGIGHKLENRIKLLQDSPSWRSDLRSAFIEFIRTRDTKRVTRKMSEEIIPTMINMRPELMKRFENMNLDVSDPESLGMNPEWEEALNASGITDKLKEMSELQSEGADVFLSTFSHLKRFPFFHEPAGWFMPFDPESTRVRKALAGNESAARMISNLSFLCDSDKYSLALSLDLVPEAQRKMMFSQFEAQGEQFFEAMAGANATSVDDMRRSMRNYLQNLYRFLELFRRKGEFYNPFDKGVNLLTVSILAEDFDDTETLRVIAEFFFRLGYWQDALEVFTLVSRLDGNDASLWQKIGFCRQSLGDMNGSVEAYERAEMLSPGSKWLWRRLYAAYRALGKYDRALEYARRLADDESLTATLNFGYALLEAGKTAEALTEFRRAEFIDENSSRPLRPIAWTLFLEGRVDDSRRYYSRIIAGAPTPEDFLNFGHLELSAGRMREAFGLYQQSLDAGLKADDFYSRIAEDIPELLSLGVPAETIAMISDAVSSERQSLPPYGRNDM